MHLLRAEDVGRADRAAVAAGTPVSTLMERAGRAVAEAARLRFGERRAVVLCGPGNNGGDGYVAARLLAEEGLAVQVLEMRAEPSTEAAADAREALRARLEPVPLTPDAVREAVRHGGLVIDALLGSGARRPLQGELAEVADLVNARARVVLAVDAPSGVDVDRAVPPGPHVRAHHTVQLGGAKPASVLQPARGAYGRWSVAPLGLPRAVLEDPALPRLWGAGDVRRALPPRAPEVHKYRVGTVLVVAGSERYAGAAALACRGAHRGGAGLVTLAAPQRPPGGMAETVLEPVRWEDADPVAPLRALPAARCDAAVLGPGLEDPALRNLPRLLHLLRGPVILDGGALRPDLRDAARSHGSAWLTPHHGEAARLLGTSAREVAADPLGAAQALARAWGSGVVLKGAGTAVADVDGALAVSRHGTAAMASGGSGDVLAGLLGALLARPSASGDATAWARAASATWLHGRAGERAARARGVGLTATDVAEALPHALGEAGASW